MVWSCSFHSSFSLVPTGKRTDEAVDLMLDGDGRTEKELLAVWPYDEARGKAGGKPDPKRVRDARQLLRTIGLVWTDTDGPENVLRVTDFGRATRRWRPQITRSNARVIARHAALALSACQLRNPLPEARGYEEDVVVFPFQFIWKAMLQLEGRITSDELNRSIYKTKNSSDLDQAIGAIRAARAANDVTILGPEVAGQENKNDRVLVWMCWASFGWSLIQDKRRSTDGKSYTIADPWAWRILSIASGIHHEHRVFASERAYVEYISRSAGIPKDVR